MTGYVLFTNNTDVSVNKVVASRTGEAEAYNSAVKFFKERRITNHQYVIIRKDAKKPTDARVYTNMFGEIEGLCGVPWLFDKPV